MTDTTSPAPKVPDFFLDADPERHYPAHGYGPWWNGWATPIVDHGTFVQLLTANGIPFAMRTDDQGHSRFLVQWDDSGEYDQPLGEEGDEDVIVFRPLERGPYVGLYDLANLAWTFSKADD